MISARPTVQPTAVFAGTATSLRYISCLLVLLLILSCVKESVSEPEPVDPLLQVKMEDLVGKWKAKDSEESIEFAKKEGGNGYYGVYVYYSDWYKGYDTVRGSAYFHPVGSIQTPDRVGVNKTPEIKTQFTYFYIDVEFVIDASGNKLIRSKGLNPVSYYKEE